MVKTGDRARPLGRSPATFSNFARTSRLAQDQVLVAADLDLGAAVLRVDDLVADGDVERDQLAVLVAARCRQRGRGRAAASPWPCRAGRSRSTVTSSSSRTSTIRRSPRGFRSMRSRLRLPLCEHVLALSYAECQQRMIAIASSPVNPGRWHSPSESAEACSATSSAVTVPATTQRPLRQRQQRRRRAGSR